MNVLYFLDKCVLIQVEWTKIEQNGMKWVWGENNPKKDLLQVLVLSKIHFNITTSTHVVLVIVSVLYFHIISDRCIRTCSFIQKMCEMC